MDGTRRRPEEEVVTRKTELKREDVKLEDENAQPDHVIVGRKDG